MKKKNSEIVTKDKCKIREETKETKGKREKTQTLKQIKQIIPFTKYCVKL